MKKILMLLFAFCWSALVYAQQKVVTGVVSDSQGPLPGVLVSEKGNDFNSVSSGIDGSFRITLKDPKSTSLVFKMIGLKTREVNVSAVNSINVRLEEDTKGLDEVIVVGYGSKSRITNTGAISHISGAEIRQNPAASVQNTLMGRIPGVFSQQTSGQPGADASRISIRGAASYTGVVNPLIIVDDIKFTQPLSDLDADQIESISVLKDASAVAIYGVEGANGVILIKTRRGTSGKPSISFRTEVGLQTPTIPFDFLGSYDVARLEKQAYENVGSVPRFTDEDIQKYKDGSDPYGYPDVDWADVILKDLSTQVRNNLNISGGTEKAKYFISVGHLYQNGIMEDFSSKESGFNSNYYYKRYNFKSNIDLKVTNSLALNVDLTGFTGEKNNPWLRGTSNNPFFELNDYMRLPPFAYPIYNPDGTYGGNNTRLANLAYNIVGRMSHLGYQRSYTNGFTSTIGATQNLEVLTKGLSAKGSVSYNIGNTTDPYIRNLTRQSFPSYIYNSANQTYTIFDVNTLRMPQLSLATDQGTLNKSLNLQGSFNYDRTFDAKHKVYGLALYNQFSSSLGASEPISIRGFSFRAGYDYKQKYMIELVAAYNGSSAFPSQNRYNWFPAMSLGWNIAEESFFKDNISFIDMFKVRFSKGRVGDGGTGIDPSQYVEKYTEVANAYNFGEVYSSATNNLIGISEGTLPNYNIRWELEDQTNYGLDINAFKGKLRFTADYFNRYRYDIFRARQAVPVYVGASLPPANYASLRMKGFEVETSYRNNIKNFNYFASYNVSYTMSTIVQTDEAIPKYPYQAQTGKRIGLPLGYIFDGFYTPENIDSSVKPTNLNVAPGDLRYKDLNGDGVINEDDKTRLGYSNIVPLVMGFTFGGSYKNFSASITMQAGLGFALRSLSTQIIPFVNNLRSVHLDTWTEENRDASLPRLMPTWVGTVNDPNLYLSDFWNKRADYLRLKTFEFSYSIPKKIVQKARLEGVRIYANGNNLFTWFLKDKNIYNLDPESTSGSAIQSYPQMTIYNFGLQVNFK